MPDLNRVAWIAYQEFRTTMRDHWTWVTAGMLMVLTLAISYFGLVQQGQTGLQNFDVTISSLVSLVIYLIPLIALLLGYASVSGEREQGTLSLLLSMPLSSGEVICGKFFGLALALTFSTGLGLGTSGLLILWRTGNQGWLNFLYFLLSTILLGLVFLSIGLLISVLARRKAGAAVSAVFTWFFFTFIYDLIILGATIILHRQIKVSWLAALLFINPGDIFRVVNLVHFASLRASLGLVDQVSSSFLNSGLLTVLFVVWIITPLFVATKLLQECDI